MLTLLATTPMWLTFAALFFLCIGILPLIRWYFEGFPYNIAISSAYGDVALLVCVMIGIDVLQSRGAPDFLYDYQIEIAAVSVCAGIVNAFVIAGGLRRRNTVADSYHNLVVVSLLVYLVLGTALPIISELGPWTVETYSAIFFYSVWLATLIYDLATGRAQQTRWLREHGRRVDQV